MKNAAIIIFIMLIGLTTIIGGCKTNKEVNNPENDVSQNIMPPNNKSGAQLWGENCVRCHNAPPPQTYTNAQWTTIGQHMRVRANISQKEVDKIITFIKSAN